MVRFSVSLFYYYYFKYYLTNEQLSFYRISKVQGSGLVRGQLIWNFCMYSFFILMFYYIVYRAVRIRFSILLSVFICQGRTRIVQGFSYFMDQHRRFQRILSCHFIYSINFSIFFEILIAKKWNTVRKKEMKCKFHCRLFRLADWLKIWNNNKDIQYDTAISSTNNKKKPHLAWLHNLFMYIIMYFDSLWKTHSCMFFPNLHYDFCYFKPLINISFPKIKSLASGGGGGGGIGTCPIK